MVKYFITKQNTIMFTKQPRFLNLETFDLFPDVFLKYHFNDVHLGLVLSESCSTSGQKGIL